MKYDVIIQLKAITARILSPSVHLNDILPKNEPKVIEISTVCTNLTETPTDTTRELSNDQKYRPQFGTVIKVGKAVIFVSFTFYRLLRRKKYLFIFHFDIKRKYSPQLSRNLAKFGSKHEMLGKIFVNLPSWPALF